MEVTREATRREVANQVAETLLKLAREPGQTRAAILEALRPTPEDVKAIFVAEAAAVAARTYARFPLEIVAPGAVRAATRIARAPELAAPPPGWDKGYATVAPWLRPGSTWVSWTYFDRKDEPIRNFDGLVIREGRCCWCPRPWRVLAELGIAERSSVLGYWID
jgi:hypothetical protein